MLLLLPILTLPALLSVFFVGFFCPDAHLRLGYLASLVGLPSPHFPGSLLPLAELELFPGFNHSVFAPLAVYCAKCFEVIPHPVLFSPHIPAPNLAQNISSYQPWLHVLVNVDDIYVPAQFPIFEAALDFDFLFIPPVAEFKLWLFAHFLGLIAVAACCPYFGLFGCDFFSRCRISLPKKILSFAPENLTSTSTYGRPFFTSAFGSSYTYPCFLTIPTTYNCLPIQTETTDTTCIHPSPSDLELDSCISPSHSETHLNEFGLRAPLVFGKTMICHDNPVDSDRITINIKEAKLDYCPGGLLPLGETSELIRPTVDGDTRDLEEDDASLSLSNKSVWEHITIDSDLKFVTKEALVDESNVGMSKVSHINIITTKQNPKEHELFFTFDNTLTNATIDQAPETIQCLSSAVGLSYSENKYKPSYRIGMELEQQIINRNACEARQNITNGSVGAISPSSFPILMEISSDQTRTTISKVDPVINCAEQTSESESLLKDDLTECEVKVKRKRGCRGGVKVHKRIAARQQAAAKELECSIIETESLEHDKESHAMAEDNLLALDSPNYLVVPPESDNPDLPIISEIETVEPELQVVESTTPVYIKEGKMFKPGYVKKRGCRGKKKSKRQAQLSCDNPPPIQLHSD